MAKNTIKTLTAGILACCMTVAGNAEITGSGLLNLDCDGVLDLNIWVDNNENGFYDNVEAGVPAATVILSKVDAPELGIEIIQADLSGVVTIGSLCHGEYALKIESDSIPDTVNFDGAYESGELVDTPDSAHTVTVVLGDGLDEASPGQRQIDLAFNQIDCALEAVASCGEATVAVGEITDYRCDKPVSELSLVWNGNAPVRVVAHAGKLDKPVIADFDHIIPGQVVRVAGLEDSGNDFIWEIYAAGTDIRIGESSFHLSCSDDYMNGPEDCGVTAGDGKDNNQCTDDDCINDWLFAGMIDKNNEIQCLSTGVMTADAACEIYPGRAYAVRYQVSNNTEQALGLSNISENVGSPGGSELPLFVGGEQVEFAYFGQGTEGMTRRFTADSGLSGLSCNVETTAAVSIMELPPACDAVAVELRELKHDQVKLRFTNSGDRELGLLRYQLTWPQEHVELTEVKWDGGKIHDHKLSWEPLTVHGVDDFLLDTAHRLIPADDHVEIEIKFGEHVHNSPQVYELEFDFDTDCSIAYSIAP